MLKRRFRILLLAPEYNLDIQARIPTALCAIHNFIRKHEPDEQELQATLVGDNFHDPDEGADAAEDAEDGDLETGMGAIRDRIATEMWEAYSTHILQEQLQVGDMLDDSDGDDFEDEDV